MKSINKLLYLCLLFFPLIVNSQNKVNSALEEFLNSEGFKHASIAISVSDVRTGNKIINYNSHLSLIPASCLKIITTATALEILGSNYKFKTVLYEDGHLLDDGTLYGNLIVKGYGDPSLNSMYFPARENVISNFSKVIKNRKIKRITGDVIADNSYFKAEIPSTWIWEDIANYYGATAHALSYKDNFYTLFFNSFSIGELTKIDRVYPLNLDLHFENEVVAAKSNRDNAYIYGDPKTKFRFIKGSIPCNKKDFTVKGSNANPAIVIANDIADLIPHSDVHVSNVNITETLEKHKIATYYSPSLAELIYVTNNKSVNLFAEHIFLSIGDKQYTPSYSISRERLLKLWKTKNISTAGICICDGSGLSRSNLLTTTFVDKVLRYMFKSVNYNSFYRSLPIAATSGTLSNFAKNTLLKNNFVAKTGTISKVRSMCGYLNTKTNKTLSVSIIVNNNDKSFSIVNKNIEKLLLELYKL